MLGFDDFLGLRKETDASRFLKPWSDVVIDYIIRVLLMMAVVTGVVAMCAKDPVCVPAIKCPTTSNCSFKQEVCAAHHNSCLCEDNPPHSAATILKKPEDESLFEFVNSECRRACLPWLFRFFPNMIYLQVGACLVVHNAWFVLQAAVVNQFIALVKECYESSESNLKEPMKSARAKKRKLLEVNIQEFVDQSDAKIDLEKRDAVKEYLKLVGLQRKVEAFIEYMKSNKTSSELSNSNEDKSDGILLLGIRSIRETVIGTYKLELFVQLLILIVCFGLHLYIVCGVLTERFDCSIDEKITGLDYDHYICSYPLGNFYYSDGLAFMFAFGLHILVSVYRLISRLGSLRARGVERDPEVERGPEVERDPKVERDPGVERDPEKEHDTAVPPDLAFLESLLEASNPPYFTSFSKMRLQWKKNDEEMKKHKQE